MLFTQKCNYVCRHLSNRPVCYVKFCVYVYELMRIFMFSHLTFTIYSFQTYFIRYLWLLGRQIGIFFRHTCICLKNQREEITWLCRCMCTISCYLISCAANLLNSAWVWRAFEWPERCDIRKHSHLCIISLRICSPCEIRSGYPHLRFSSSIGLAGIKAAACSSIVLCPELFCELCSFWDMW